MCDFVLVSGEDVGKKAPNAHLAAGVRHLHRTVRVGEMARQIASWKGGLLRRAPAQLCRCPDRDGLTRLRLTFALINFGEFQSQRWL